MMENLDQCGMQANQVPSIGEITEKTSNQGKGGDISIGEYRRERRKENGI
jgi:hypothetical protein